MNLFSQLVPGLYSWSDQLVQYSLQQCNETSDTNRISPKLFHSTVKFESAYVSQRFMNFHRQEPG